METSCSSSTQWVVSSTQCVVSSTQWVVSQLNGLFHSCFACLPLTAHGCKQLKHLAANAKKNGGPQWGKSPSQNKDERNKRHKHNDPILHDIFTKLTIGIVSLI